MFHLYLKLIFLNYFCDSVNKKIMMQISLKLTKIEVEYF